MKGLLMNNIQQLQNRIEYLEKENQYLKNLLDKAGISMKCSEIWRRKNYMIQIKVHELFIRRLQRMMQICFSACFGDARMYTVKGLLKNQQVKLITIHSATIFGKTDVPE